MTEHLTDGSEKREMHPLMIPLMDIYLSEQAMEDIKNWDKNEELEQSTVKELENKIMAEIIIKEDKPVVPSKPKPPKKPTNPRNKDVFKPKNSSNNKIKVRKS